jgi:hypothetical protein
VVAEASGLLRPVGPAGDGGPGAQELTERPECRAFKARSPIALLLSVPVTRVPSTSRAVSIFSICDAFPFMAMTAVES